MLCLNSKHGKKELSNAHFLVAGTALTFNRICLAILYLDNTLEKYIFFYFSGMLKQVKAGYLLHFKSKLEIKMLKSSFKDTFSENVSDLLILLLKEIFRLIAYRFDSRWCTNDLKEHIKCIKNRMTLYWHCIDIGIWQQGCCNLTILHFRSIYLLS